VNYNLQRESIYHTPSAFVIWLYIYSQSFLFRFLYENTSGQLAGSRANKKGETSKTLAIKIATRIPDSTVPFYLLCAEPTFYRCNFSYLFHVLFIALSLPNDPLSIQ
jgi:hypothetical protein